MRPLSLLRRPNDTGNAADGGRMRDARAPVYRRRGRGGANVGRRLSGQSPRSGETFVRGETHYGAVHSGFKFHQLAAQSKYLSFFSIYISYHSYHKWELTITSHPILKVMYRKF